jgi:hypothetical protein
VTNENRNAWTPTPDPCPQGGGEKLTRRHVAVLAVVAITALIAIVPFVFAIIHAGP